MGRTEKQTCEWCKGAHSKPRWRFCSLSCKNAHNGAFTAQYHRKRRVRLLSIPITERLFAGRILDKQKGCWRWQYGHAKSGYAEIRVVPNTQPITLHRLSAMLWLGYVPSQEWQVLHKCDVKGCFNPAHLYIGTPKDNGRDASDRGQSARGERNGMARLTSLAVKTIRRKYNAGCTQRLLAKQFHVSQGHVSGLVRGLRWAQLV